MACRLLRRCSTLALADARNAYLNEVLIRRQGTAAALAVLYAEIMQRLLRMGAVDFAVRMDCNDPTRWGSEAPPAAASTPAEETLAVRQVAR